MEQQKKKVLATAGVAAVGVAAGIGATIGGQQLLNPEEVKEEVKDLNTNEEEKQEEEETNVREENVQTVRHEEHVVVEHTNTPSEPTGVGVDYTQEHKPTTPGEGGQAGPTQTVHGPSDEPHVIAYETVTASDGTEMDVALIESGDEHILVYDIDRDGTADALVHDDNKNGQIEENEIQDISDKNISMETLHEDYLATTGGGQEVDPDDIHVVGYETVVTDDGDVMAVATLQSGDDKALLVDADYNGTADVLIHDDNKNGQIEENELHDVSDQNINMNTVEQAYYTENQLNGSTSDDNIYAANDDIDGLPEATYTSYEEEMVIDPSTDCCGDYESDMMTEI